MPNTIKGVDFDPIREKLIELLRNSLCFGYDDVTDTDYVMWNETADRLIANGVTISTPQKTIPQKVTGEGVRVGNGLWKKGTTVFLCPKCGKPMPRYSAYCYSCGQLLDWEDE